MSEKYTDEFSILLGHSKSIVTHRLTVRGVMGCTTKDSEHIGIYDINYLSVDIRKCMVRIIGCIPITIELRVTPEFTMELSEV